MSCCWLDKMAEAAAALAPMRHPSHITTKLAHVTRPSSDDTGILFDTDPQHAASSRPLYSLEFFPPKTTQGLDNLYSRIARMAHPSGQLPFAPEQLGATDEEQDVVARPSWVQVTWGAGGSTEQWSLEMASRVQSGQLPSVSSAFPSARSSTPARPPPAQLDALLHLTCTNVTPTSLRSTLLAARKAGIRNILALRGDPPRGDEYWVASDSRFQHATDLVHFIRAEHPDGFFCVGVAGYPEGHPDDAFTTLNNDHTGDRGRQQVDPVRLDIRNLLAKQAAGAEFIITQLFYDLDAFLSWEMKALAAGVKIPIIPGLMPILNFQSFRRMTSLCRVTVPQRIWDDLQAIKADDAKVRTYGVELCKSMIRTIWTNPYSQVRAFHLCTLNLERSITRIVTQCEWWSNVAQRLKAIEDGTTAPDQPLLTTAGGASTAPRSPRAKNLKIQSDYEERAQQTKAISHLSVSPKDAVHASLQALASSPKDSLLSTILSGGSSSSARSSSPSRSVSSSQQRPPAQQRSDAAWDEFPNGRFGDIRSPAYGEMDGYGVSLKIPPAEALRTWGAPATWSDLSRLFVDYLEGKLEVIPWCDGPLMEETDSIRDALLRLNAEPDAGKGWWTVGSQPAVDGVASSDPVFGFGPRGGYVYQKSFVEFFVTEHDKLLLQRRIADEGSGQITFFAGNRAGEFETNMEPGRANAVTWAVFPGQEIVQPTMIEEESFKAWCQEAFAIWAEWELLFAAKSPSRKLLHQVGEERWLMTVVHHGYKQHDALWDFLLAPSTQQQ